MEWNWELFGKNILYAIMLAVRIAAFFVSIFGGAYVIFSLLEYIEEHFPTWLKWALGIILGIIITAVIKTISDIQ